MVKKKSKKWNKSHVNALQLLTVGTVTGVFVGTIVTFYQILITFAEEYARGASFDVRQNPWFIPVLVLALAMGAFLIGVIANISSMASGCGVPQIEGATRGFLRFRWFRDATAMCASTLISVFLGLSIGSEGPSMFIGACVGDGVGDAMRRNQMMRRYQMTGGACTGLAVVSNAPLTGIIFAFEEAHKRFTPEVFVCSFVSVIFGLLSRTVIFKICGFPITPSFQTFIFQELSSAYYPLVALCAVLCGALGVVFCKSCIWFYKTLHRIRLRKPQYSVWARVAIAVFLGGLASWISISLVGGGHELINGLGTLAGGREMSVERVFGLPLVWSLVIIFVLKMLVTGVNVGSGIPCGIFVPIIAIGACVGGIINVICVRLGMPAQYADLITMICMASVFATVVRAPLTAIIMICEFTGSIAPLLPVVIAVAIGYAVGELFHVDGIYETLLKTYEQEEGISEEKVKRLFVVTVGEYSLADRREVRDVLWPAGARVIEIVRGEETIHAEADSVLRAGDVLKIECKTSNVSLTQEDLQGITQ